MTDRPAHESVINPERALALMRAESLDLDPTLLRIAVRDAPDREVPEPDSGAVEVRWQAMRRDKPRLFDGPLLAFDRYDTDTLTVHAHASSYKRLAVQPEVRTGVMQLSVTGALLARDANGQRCVLLAKRSPETRIYGRMWELAPSGGLDAPASAERMPGGTRLDGLDAWRQLTLEIDEELGLPVSPDIGRICALVADPIAMSTDLVFSVPLVRPVEDLIAASDGDTAHDRWEYTETRWVPLNELPAFDAVYAGKIIPPSRAVFRALGWV